MNAIEEAALPVCHYFDRNITKVFPTLGWEQEYFLVDEALFYARPDMVMTGRTLFGNPPAKGQQLDDHYFGTIPERAYEFMRDFEKEVHKLGIPVTTRHNEVAPSQFECAPMYEELNISVDHNQLLKDVMDRIARKHHLRILLHEKPYAGVNGSGKHNNWSLGTDTGKNLLSPGKTPKNRLQFLTFFVNTIKAVKDNADLLRASIASAGNDFRLGANEAPPAIISVFLGSVLNDVLHDIQERVEKSNKFTEAFKSELKIDIHNKIPNLFKDNTDRNRTSPFAFTGNKFEFRAVGSSANCAEPMIALNAIVARQLKQFKKNVDAYIKEGYKKDGAILKELSNCIKDSWPIIFGGDGYSDEWVKDAKKRGLSNIKDTPRALDAYVSDKFIDLFKESKIFRESELHARHEIKLENYIIKNQIEARVSQEIAMNQILPAALDYQNKLLSNISAAKQSGIEDESINVKINIYKKVSSGIKGIVDSVNDIQDKIKKADSLNETRKTAIAYYDDVKASVEQLRDYVDLLENWVDDENWPLPKYRELLFVR
jgi:glutamine synthetase